MTYKKISIKCINIIYKRHINTDKLQELMSQILKNKTLENTKNVNEFLEKMNKLKEKIEVKIETKNYETIQDQLKESINEIRHLREQFKNIREKSINIDIKVEEKLEKLDKIKLEELNINNKSLQDIKIIDKKLGDNYGALEKVDEIVIKNSENIKKSIFEIEWLQPFFDLMNNHSTLVLTIGSGLIMGGMWYLNNVGYINIGSLLTRLGINIFANNNNNSIPQAASTSPIVINNVIENTERSIGQRFFRQLGVKVLELLDVFIEKMKNKQQKYK